MYNVKIKELKEITTLFKENQNLILLGQKEKY